MLWSLKTKKNSRSCPNPQWVAMRKVQGRQVRGAANTGSPAGNRLPRLRRSWLREL